MCAVNDCITYRSRGTYTNGFMYITQLPPAVGKKRKKIITWLGVLKAKDCFIIWIKRFLWPHNNRDIVDDIPQQHMCFIYVCMYCCFICDICKSISIKISPVYVIADMLVNLPHPNLFSFCLSLYLCLSVCLSLFLSLSLSLCLLLSVSP